MITFSNTSCGLKLLGYKPLQSNVFYLNNKIYDIGDNIVIFLDTRDGQFSLKFPSQPKPGDIRIIVDIGGNLESEPVKILDLNMVFSAHNNEFILNKNYSTYHFFYVSDDIGWVYDFNYLGIVSENSSIINIQTVINYIIQYKPISTNYIIEEYPNLYFTVQRVRESITAISPLNFNRETGVISINPIQISWSDILNKPLKFESTYHSHSASDINEGVLNINRIPTGNTSDTVSLGNHTHLYLPLSGGVLTGRVDSNSNINAPNITFIIKSPSNPSGGSDGDVWLQYV